MWIDIHAHLYELSREEILDRMNQAAGEGVAAVINAATSIESALKVLEQSAYHQQLYATLGVSAFDVEELGAGWDTTLENLLDNSRVVGVGEIGLDDTKAAYPALDRQRAVFETQLDIARRHNLPAVIHSRGAEKRTIETCVSLGITRAVFHCFTGGIEDLRFLLDAGYYVSFSGIITFKKGGLEQLVAFAPLDRLFIETDTPYLAPVPHRGSRNQPAWVRHVGESLASIKGIAPEHAAGQIARNVAAVFGITT